MISLLCPTRGRPQRVSATLWSAAETCTEPFTAVFLVDRDDEATLQELAAWGQTQHDRIATLTWVVVPRLETPMSNWWNLCAAEALTNHPDWALLFIDDEAKFVTPGWDRLIVQELQRWPDGAILVHPNDGIHGDLAAGYFAVTPTWVQILGRLTPPMFTYGYADVWCLEVAAAVGRNVYLPQVLIENLAPKLQPPDHIHLDNEARAVAYRPGDLYHATQVNRERDVQLLKDHIQNWSKERML